jgi:hypothetical protein
VHRNGRGPRDDTGSDPQPGAGVSGCVTRPNEEGTPKGPLLDEPKAQRTSFDQNDSVLRMWMLWNMFQPFPTR